MSEMANADRGAAPGLRADLVERLLRPKSIVIAGVSARPGSPGQTVAKMLDQNGFAGEIHLVGRSGGTLGERTVHESFDDVPFGIDLAVLALPAAAVPDAIEDCVGRKIGAAVVFASGFAETGDEAREIQSMLTQRVEEGGLGLAGPNCLGFTNYIDRIDVGFIPVPPVIAPSADQLPAAAIIAQSGGLMGHACQALEGRNVPLAYRISTGNEAGLGLSDYIAYMAKDPAVSVIALYAEHIRRPAEFLQAARDARAAGKNLVLYHTGRGAKAQAAAASHTGALAGDYATIAVLAAHAGILVVDTLEEWIDCTEVLVRYPIAPVLDPAVVTTSGAFCAIAHDCFEELDLELPEMSPESEARLRPRLPEFTPPKNPLDLTTQVAFDIPLTAEVVSVFGADPKIGSISVAVPAFGPAARQWLEPFVDAVKACPKPVLLTALGEDMPLPRDFEELARGEDIVLSRSPERALRTAAAITHYGRQLQRKPVSVEPLPADAIPDLRPGLQPEWVGKQILNAIGVNHPAGGLAKSENEAAAIAESIGYPVVLKVQAAELAHKTEIGGVVLNLSTEAAVRAAYNDLVARVKRTKPGTVLDGVLVEGMAVKGLELVVGAKRDPRWGPVVLVGLGGVMVEALKDVRLIPPDLSTDAIIEELRKLKSAKLLGAFRGSPPRDIEAIAKVVAAVGRLMVAHPDIVEVDINPLLAMAEGEGVVALDALIVTQAMEN